MRFLNKKWSNHIRIVLLIGIILNLFNCSSNNEDVEEIGGDVDGNVILYDLAGLELTDKSNVIVKIKDEKHNFSTPTATDGTFHFGDIPIGEYTITFGKLNFSGMNEFTLVKEIGNSTYSNIKQAEIPDAEITLTSYAASTGNCYNPKGSITVNPNNTVSVFFYYSKSQDVSAENYTWSEWTCCYSSGIYDYTSCGSTLGGMFNTNDKVYVVAYVGNQKLIGDLALQLFAFPTHNDQPSGTVNFIMP